jgi:hypothetical protein
MIFNYELQTAALFAGLLSYAAWTLYRWHTDPLFKNFCLLDLIAEDGRLSSRKFMEVGSFLIASAVVVVVTVRGTVSWEWIAGYCSVFVLGRAVGQSVHAYQSINQNRNRGGGDPRECDDDEDRPPARPRRESIIK